MTVSPDVPWLAAASLADAVAALRERGLRLSTARRLVLEVLFAADGPVSAEHVARRLNIDAASVHRNFEALELQGLVRHVHLGHGPGLYALLRGGEREYLYCDRCGAVTALSVKELDPVRKHVKKRYGYEARFDHFAIVGTCAACSVKRRHKALSQSSGQGDRATMQAPEEYRHEHSHAHNQEHADRVVHEHPHADLAHQHVAHEHQHSHGDHVHSHRHVHRQGLGDRHEHGH